MDALEIIWGLSNLIQNCLKSTFSKINHKFINTPPDGEDEITLNLKGEAK